MTASIRGGIFTMAMLLKGAEVAKALTEELHAKTEELKKNGVEPCLAILRVGAREDDLAYERGALKRCEKVGVAVRQVVLPEDVTQEVLMENIHALGADEKVHGVLMFRPLPGHLDDEAARAALDPKKDMDGITDGSMTAVYAGTKGGYPPCTAAACVALLKHYNIPIKGKRVVVIGRSLVIGKPVSLLLLAEHATVTICHSRSENLPDICREADILVVAAGKAGMVGAESVRVEADARRYVPDGDGGTAPLYSRAFRLLRPVAARGLLPLFTQWGAGGDEAGFPAAVLNRVGKGKVVYIPAAVARDYDFNRMPAIRAFFGLVLREAAVETAVALNAPSWVDLTLRRSGEQLQIHLINRATGIPNLPNQGAVAEIPATGPLAFRLKTARKPRSVRGAWEHAAELEWSWEEGILSGILPRLRLYEAVLID